MSRSLILFAALTLLLVACDQSPQEPASAAPDAADTASADAQPAAAQSTPADSSASTLPIKKPSATDATMPGATVAPIATVGAAGYGELHFGMSRGEAEQAAGGAFTGSTQSGACQQVSSAGQPGIAYLFAGDKLQRIDVQAPAVMADGGGRIGMQVDDIRTLYAGHLTEQARKSVPGGQYLKVVGKNGAGIIFETDADGKVTAFRAGVASALERDEGCS